MLLAGARCVFCKEPFASQAAFNQHIENLRAFACIYCQYCNESYRLEKSNRHHDVSYQCKICDSYLTVKGYLGHKCFHRKSAQNKANKAKVVCESCKGAFFSKDDLIVHIRECGKGGVFVCECCDKSFLNSEDHASHMMASQRFKKNARKYECRFCQKQFVYKNEKTSHEKQAHISETVTCTVCHKELPFNRLGPHSRWHRTREKYKTKPPKVCDICGFASKFIARHMKIHREERRYKCNVCDKSFKLSSCLSNHKLVHSDVARHKCNICEKAFKSNFNLQVHLRSHEIVKPFPCLVCEKTFTTKQSRDNHLKTHDNR